MAIKKRFRVEDNETIEQCLDRMDKEGYKVVRRIEEPIFCETNVNGKKKVEVLKQEIIFVGVPKGEL